MNGNEHFKDQPLPYDLLTKVKGDPMRHIEQLWDEIEKLKEEVKKLKKNK